jgi:hypothetical protein
MSRRHEEEIAGDERQTKNNQKQIGLTEFSGAR